ncbi:uncharacterized protein KZ484_008579 [Pholidichthys leucotaenia]
MGVSANAFVMMAVYRQKSLQTSINALVVNLAVIDFLRCVIDCPILLTIVVSVHQRRHVYSFICDTQMASFSFSCCIQLLTLACISAERYHAIAQPFKASQRKRRIKALIPLTWTLAILVAIFCLIFLKDSPVHMRCQGQRLQTSFSYDRFGLYMLFPLWAACFGVIIGFYARIFALVRAHSRKIFDKGTFPLQKNVTNEDKQKKEETTLVENGKSKQNQTPCLSITQTKTEPISFQKTSSATLLTSVKNPECLPANSENKQQFKDIEKISELEIQQVEVAAPTEECPLKTKQSDPCARKAEENPSNRDAVSNVKDSTPKKVSSNFNSEQVLETNKESKEPTSISLIEQEQAKSNGGGEIPAPAAPDQMSQLPAVSGSLPETGTTQQAVAVEGAVCMMPSKAGKERVRKVKEGHFFKTAAILILKIMIIQDLEILSVSVACITSLSDPIIYAAVNPQFSTEFYRLKNRVKSLFSKK